MTRTSHRLLALMLLLSIAVFTRAGTASACSCMAPEPATALHFAPAGFVGTYTGHQKPTGWLDYVLLRFEVEQWVKGDLGNPVYVKTDFSSSCGLRIEPGSRLGVVLQMSGEFSTAGSCDTSSAAAMLAAAKPLIVDGRGPPRYIVSAAHQSPILFFDGNGGLVGTLDPPAGIPILCEGERLVAVPYADRIVLYDLSKLSPVRSYDISPLLPFEFHATRCDETGDSMVVTVRDWPHGPFSSVIELPDRVLASGPYLEIREAGGGWLGLTASEVVLIDATGNSRVIHSTEFDNAAPILNMSLSPSEGTVAISESHSPVETLFYAYRVETGELLDTFDIEPLGDLGPWRDDATLSVDRWTSDADVPEWFTWSPATQTVKRADDAPIWGGLTDGDRLVAVQAARLISVALDDPSDVVELAALRNDGYGLIAVLHGAQPIQGVPANQQVAPPVSDTVVGEVPALFLPARSPPKEGAPPWLIGGVAAGVLFATSAWIYRRRRLRLP